MYKIFKSNLLFLYMELLYYQCKCIVIIMLLKKKKTVYSTFILMFFLSLCTYFNILIFSPSGRNLTINNSQYKEIEK